MPALVRIGCVALVLAACAIVLGSEPALAPRQDESGTDAAQKQAPEPAKPEPAAEQPEPKQSPGPAGPASTDAPTALKDKAKKYEGLCFDSKELDARVSISGYFTLWALIEQNQNGKMNPVTSEEAAQEASGFAIRYARLEGGLDFRRIPVSCCVSLRLEGSPNLLDAYLKWSPLGKHLDILAGQMKVPSAYEVSESTEATDFASRSQFSERVVDYSLVRGGTLSSAFPGARAYLRDIGAAVKARYMGASLFFMIGNGLGSNFNVGGLENKGFAFANDFGAWYYGVRLEFDAVEALAGTLGKDFPVRSFRIGGHACWNRHPQLIMNDERTVVEIDRRSWSWEVRADVLGLVRLTWMMGAGFIEDDFDYDRKTDYEYRGWEARVMVVVVPGILEAGFRWDAWFDEKSNSEDEEYLDAYTFGVNATVSPHFRFQLNYKAKVLTSSSRADLADDVFVLSAQFSF